MLNEYYYLIYLLFFCGAAIFSVLINKILLKFSQNLGVRNHLEMPRWSKVQKPSIGGISFYIIFLLSVATISILPLDDVIDISTRQLFGLFVASTLGFLIGLADDAYNTKPALKFLGQLTCANILIAAGFVIEITPAFWLNYFITFLWVIGIMNSINMLDNMDGITASISTSIILGVFMIMALQSDGFNTYGIILLGVAAALTGFLYYNWHPSRMFMGDTGSQFLGVFLSAISIIFLWQFKSDTKEFIQVRQFLAPLLLFIMPIIDTTTVFIRRISRGQSPFVGGRDHTTHHLAYLGLKDGQVAGVFTAISVFSIVLLYFLYRSFDNWNAVYNILVIGYFMIVFAVFQYLYEIGKRKNRERSNIAINENGEATEVNLNSKSGMQHL